MAFERYIPKDDGWERDHLDTKLEELYEAITAADVAVGAQADLLWKKAFALRERLLEQYPDHHDEILNIAKPCAKARQHTVRQRSTRRPTLEITAEPGDAGWAGDKPVRGKLAHADALDFILAGNATVTLLNTDTGGRYTYKVVQPKDDMPHFVRLLNGPDNTADYVYMATIFDRTNLRHTRKSAIRPSAKPFAGFRFVWERLVAGELDALPSNLEIWHEGRCGRCGRVLTVPESVARGIGPVCAGKV